MAHFAEINSDNLVVNVLVVDNKDCLDDYGNESEAVGIQFLKDLFGSDKNYVQTSYNNNIRHNYAGIGHTWDPVADAFYAPQPFPSWKLNSNFQWEAPIPMPEFPKDADGNPYGYYFWNEETLSWDFKETL